MSTGRLEAFSDGVIAILITIMVLELHSPHGTSWAALRDQFPVLLAYLLSFVYLGIYWSNHHHMLAVVSRISGAALWANLHLLFWLSLVPFATAWLGENGFAALPAALYGVVLMMAGVAYSILQATILRAPGGNKMLADAIGRDFKGKSSVVFYAIAIATTHYDARIACVIYVLVALMWLIPDPRIEKKMVHTEHD
jgi:uncharacterized membrane protein